MELTKALEINELLNEDIEKGDNQSNELPSWSSNLQHSLKIRGKMGLEVITNFLLPAVDECTDLYSGIRYLV